MSATLQNIIDIVASQRVRGASSACLTREIETVHRLVVSMIPDIRQIITTPIDIPLVNNQREYTVPDHLIQISHVVLVDGTTQRLLTVRAKQNFDNLVVSNKPWVSGTPTAVNTGITDYFVIGSANSDTTTARQIVLNSAPSAASGASLKVYGAAVETPFALNTQISPLLTSEMVYVEGLSWRAALEKNPVVANNYFASFMAAVEMEKRLIMTVAEGLNGGDGTRRNPRMK